MPRNLPSGSQLPPCWNADMDRFICTADAGDIIKPVHVVELLKDKFSMELTRVSLSI